MPKQQITTKSGASPIGAYSQGLRVGDFIFVSGQGPLDPATGKIVGDTIEEQTARVLENIKAILAAGGEDGFDVLEHTCGLLFDGIADNLPCRRVERTLTRDEDKVPDTQSLRIRADG